MRFFSRFCVVLCALIALTCSAHAATFRVTKTSDTDDGACNADCSLREAINAANGAAGDDIIDFGVTGTLTLPRQLPVLDSNIALRGPGANSLNVRRLEGADSFGIFIVSEIKSVSISGMTLTDGNTDFGGGILNFRGVLKVADVAFRNNVSTDGGGGIYNFRGDLAVENGDFTGNSSSFGGAIINYEGIAAVAGSEFRGNNASNSGGAVLNFNGSLGLTNSTFSNNFATGGGALNNFSGDSTVANCDFNSNGANNGGALYNNVGGTFDLSQSTLRGNSASREGGGMTNNRGTLSIAGTTFIDNRSTGGGRGQDLTIGGGGLYNDEGTVSMTSCTVIGNNAKGNGGGVHNLNGQVSIASSTVSGNSASEFAGGGLYNRGGSLAVALSTVRGNSSFDAGGGIFNENGPLTMTDSTVSANVCARDGGGGLFINTIDDSSGMASTIANSTFSGNRANASEGGGIFNFGGQLNIESSTIAFNSAPAGNGGGLASYGFDDTRTQLSNTLVAGNVGNDVDFVREDFNSLASSGYNLIGRGNATGNFVAAGDQSGVADPKLNALADNGGPTQTHALLAGSPAIDKGNTTSTLDQRGQTRPFDDPGVAAAAGGNQSDIGAFESQVVTSAQTINFGVSIAPKAPRTKDVLTATPVIADGGSVSYTYAWSVNGTVKQSGARNTFDLSMAGQGDKNDRVSVVVNATRGAGGAGGDAQSGTATNFVDVVNSAPVASNSSARGNAGADIDVAIRGTDDDNDALTFKSVGGPANGTGQFETDVNGRTTFVYRSRLNFSGFDEIKFVAIDSEGRPSAVATGTIRVNAVSRDIGLGVSLSPSGPDTNQVLTATPVIGDATGVSFAYAWRANGKLLSGETNSRLDLRKPGNGDKGDIVSVTLTATRGVDKGTATNSVTVVNSAPVAFSQTGVARPGVPTSFVLRGADLDGEVLTYKRVGGPVNGGATLTNNPDGTATLIYTARADFGGVEVIRFVSVDGSGRTSQVSTLGINVPRPGSSGAISSGNAAGSAPSGGSS